MKTIQLSELEIEHLEPIAKEHNTDIEDLIHKVISDYVEDQEEQKWAEEAYTEWVAGGKEIAGTFEDLKKKYDLD